jgi:hypothetical protein
LLSYLAPQLFVLNVLEDVNSFYKAAEFCQCLGESICSSSQASSSRSRRSFRSGEQCSENNGTPFRRFC